MISVSACCHSVGSAERPRAELEIAGVKQRAGVGFEEELRGAEDVAGRQQRHPQAAHVGRHAEGQDDFVSFTREPRRPFRDDDLFVRRDVVAVRVRDEGKRLRIPGIEPDAFVRQEDAAFVLDLNHRGQLAGRNGSRELRVRAPLAPARALSLPLPLEKQGEWKRKFGCRFGAGR